MTLADIATDIDATTTGNQPGANAEKFEGVLVTVQNVTASAATDANGNTKVSDGSGHSLTVSGFLLTASTAIASGAHFTSITGVANQFFDFQLDPRTPGEIVP